MSRLLALLYSECQERCRMGRGPDSRMETRQDQPCDHILWYISGWFFSSHSWHFLTVPPYSQYYLVKAC
jgi:hypothetical protein